MIKIMQTKTDPFRQFGKISKGDEIPTTKDPNKTRPIDLDHFRITYTEGNEWLADEMRKLFGDKPRALEVILHPVFPHADPLESVFPHSMQAWNATRLQVDCDAETIHRQWSDKTQSYDTSGHKCQMQLDGTCPLQCKWTGRLKVIIPALIPVAGFGYFTMTTHGKRDIEQIAGAIQFMLGRGVAIDKVLWQMLRTPATSNYKDAQGVARTREYYPVSLTVLSMSNSLFGNPTTANAPALPPTVSVNDSADYGDDNPLDYDDVIMGDLNQSIPPLPYSKELPPKSTTQGNEQYSTKGLAMAIIRSLREHHRAHSEGIGISDILFSLGVKDLEDLGKAWESQYPALTQPEYAKVVADAFVNANNVPF